MIAAVVCVDANYGIGSKNNLLVHIPEDMKRFKEITSNGSVIVGRKTYESLPKKPLPDRTNIILTRKAKKKPKLQKDGTIHSNMKYIQAWLSTQEVIKENNGIFVIGGGQIYKELLPFCERIYITKVLHSFDNVDTYFPNIDTMPEWGLSTVGEIKEHNGIQYHFCVYDRVDYEILSVQTHEENPAISEHDMVITVKTFNDVKTIIFNDSEGKDNTKVYIDDWDYLSVKLNLMVFIDQVQEYCDTHK